MHVRGHETSDVVLVHPTLMGLRSRLMVQVRLLPWFPFAGGAWIQG